MELELRRLIGYQIVVMGPTFVDNEKLQSVKLLAVEEAGIWIESQEAFDKLIWKFSKKPTAAGLAFFIPFGQITTIMAGFDSSAFT
ncbi:MAG: hypothetical protein WA510_02290 [Acidobacteriaceae bacterium]